MTRLLITGAGGLLGANLILEAVAAGHEVIGLDLDHPVRHPDVTGVKADLSLPGKAMEVFQARRPAWVIHCAAATDVDGCETHPDMAFRLNRDMAGQVAEAARLVGARLAHISTDAVFDGERGGYREEDVPRPINAYGRSKLAGEQAVAEANPEALIVRTNLYGWNAQPKSSLAEWFLANLVAGKRCPGFSDAWFSPILVNDLGRLLFTMLEAKLAGVYHVAGGECVSKYDFGVRLARVFGLDGSLVVSARLEQGALKASRGRQLCLNVERAERALGTSLPTVEEGLTRFRDLREAGHVQELKALLP
jgi:dTDP-4-dehydrorhamnose reductase